jgi:diguanylate cyclase (GGDEF)-like protein
VLAFGAWVLIDAREDAWTQATLASDNLATALSRDIERNIDIIDRSLHSADDAMRQPGLASVAPGIRQAAIFGMAMSAQHVALMSVVDAAGNPVATAYGPLSAVPNVATRDFFLFHKQHSDGGLFISQPYRSMTREGDPTIALSIRRRSADGQFIGIVVAALRLAYFNDIFNQINVGGHGVIALHNGDGRLVGRYPVRPDDVGKPAGTIELTQRAAASPTGTLMLDSPLDAVRRVMVFRRIGSLPLLLLVGQSLDEVYAPWRHKALVLGTVLFVLWGATVAVFVLFRRETLRRLASEKALAAAADELAVIAAHDSLTGLPNRRTFESKFREEWRRAVRNQTTLALVMVDADHFKRYNDGHGHQAGDRVLQSLSGCLAGNLRRGGDLAARYGGEEFVMLLPETDLGGAMQVGERVRADVEALDIPHSANPSWRMTVSIGVAAVCPTVLDNAATLLKNADEAMYEAKRSGRNCVRAAPEREQAREREPARKAAS